MLGPVFALLSLALANDCQTSVAPYEKALGEVESQLISNVGLIDTWKRSHSDELKGIKSNLNTGGLSLNSMLGSPTTYWDATLLVSERIRALMDGSEEDQKLAQAILAPRSKKLHLGFTVEQENLKLDYELVTQHLSQILLRRVGGLLGMDFDSPDLTHGSFAFSISGVSHGLFSDSRITLRVGRESLEYEVSHPEGAVLTTTYFKKSDSIIHSPKPELNLPRSPKQHFAVLGCPSSVYGELQAKYDAIVERAQDAYLVNKAH